MRSIPRRLLPHSATLMIPTGADKWQNATYGQEIQLEHVRLEPSSRVVITKENKQRQLSSLLIYDCVSSSPTGVKFETEQKIIWRGKEYTVISADPLYDEHKLHHWEVGLI